MASILKLVAAGRQMIREATGNHRILRATVSGLRTMFRSAIQVFHVFFLQAVGLLFCLFGAEFAFRIPASYREHMAGHHGLQQTAMLAGLALLFTWFGASSFWRARKNTAASRQ